MKSHIFRIIDPYQCSFMPRPQTKMILEKTHHLFVDFKQTYNTPTRDEKLPKTSRKEASHKRLSQSITIDGHQFEAECNIIHLGSEVNHDSDISAEDHAC